MKCEKCQNEITDGALFCPFCGASVQSQAPVKKSCPKCGYEPESAMLFCPQCGTDLSSKEREISETEKNRTQNVPFADTQPPDKNKAKLKISVILNIVSSSVAIIVVLLFIFLPLFQNSYYVTVGEEKVLQTEKYSLLDLSVTVFKSFSENIGLFSWIYIFVIVVSIISVIPLLLETINALIVDIKNLIAFEKYSMLELKKDSITHVAQETSRSLKSAHRGNRLYSILFDLLLLAFVLGFGDILWGNIIAIAVSTVISYILSKIAQSVKKQALGYI